MEVTIANGLIVDARVGCLVFRLSSQKVTPEEGGLQIVGFQEGLLLVQIGEEQVLVSGDGIESIACPAEAPVEVSLTDGSTVLVPASVAPLVIALVASQQATLAQVKQLLDNTQIGQLQAQLDQVKGDLLLSQVLLQKRTDALSSIEQSAQAALV